MALYLLIFSAIVVICIFFNKFSGKFGIPVLLLFLLLGLLCGSQYDGFASNWGWVVGDISTLALVFIMFYGGFNSVCNQHPDFRSSAGTRHLQYSILYRAAQESGSASAFEIGFEKTFCWEKRNSCLEVLPKS